MNIEALVLRGAAGKAGVEEHAVCADGGAGRQLVHLAIGVIALQILAERIAHPVVRAAAREDRIGGGVHAVLDMGKDVGLCLEIQNGRTRVHGDPA